MSDSRLYVLIVMALLMLICMLIDVDVDHVDAIDVFHQM